MSRNEWRRPELSRDQFLLGRRLLSAGLRRIDRILANLRPDQPIPIPKPDVVRPPTPLEEPQPDKGPDLPQPEPDVVVPPAPEVITPPQPQEIPPERPA